jgi:sterol desaturase/sphingolipid hydroxylase (fatty acid hydroxylase superfamily)
MIERGEELDLAVPVNQAGDAPESVLSRISKSRANLWACYVVDSSCPILFAYLGLRHHPGWASIAIDTLFGFVVFTLVEYAIHRWLLHNPKCFLYPLHEAHHLDPHAVSAGLFPTSLAVLMPIWLLLTAAFHWQGGSFFLCGLSAGNVYFGLIHQLEHSIRINQIPFRWMQGRWAAHSVHHHLDHTNYGVMTSFWDYVFGTHQKLAKRKSMQV